MEKSKELNVDLGQRIISFHKSGNSYITISNRLAIPRYTVQSVIKKFKQFRTTQNLRGCGRKAKLSPTTASKMYLEVYIRSRILLKDIAKSVDTIVISINTRTVRRCFNRNVLYVNQPWWTPLHKPWHMVARFNFVETFLDKENLFGAQILNSDQRKIELLGQNDLAQD